MLTVREALFLPILATSEVVAGHAGLDNQVQWVHTSDIPDARYEWRRRGVFLLTAGFSLRDSPERQAALVPKLVEEGFAGMALSVGYYFDETPAIIKETADELGFPVIETPHDLLFIDVTEAILEQITNRQYSLLQRSTQIHKQLSELVLQGGDLDDLATTLAGLLKRSITIEDPSFRVLAVGQYGPIDEARRLSIEVGRTTPQVAEILLKKGIYARLLEQMTPIYVPPMPDLEMEMERFVAPIVVGRETYGYMWIIAGDRPLTDLDEVAIDQAATVAALILFKERAVREAEESLRGDFLEQLLKGAYDSAAFMEQARRFSYRSDQPHQVLLVHGPPQAGGDGRSLFSSVQEWLKTCGAQPLLVRRDDFLVLVLEGSGVDNAGAGKQFAAALVRDLSHPACRLLIGVGTAATSRPSRSGGIRRSYEEAQEAIQIGIALGQSEAVIPFDELGLLHWLYHLPVEKRHGNAYLQHVYTLAGYDKERNTELVKTLETYLDHGGSLVDTAEILFIHRNTLLHRLERIGELCGLDLRDPTHRLNLYAAVKGYRLHQI